MTSEMPCQHRSWRTESLATDSPGCMGDTAMLDHPGWQRVEESKWIRPMRHGLGSSLVQAKRESGGIRFSCSSVSPLSVCELPIVADVVESNTIPEAHPLAEALTSLGKVVRVRNSDPWDALLTSIIRQVIRASHATRLYRQLCRAYGEEVGFGSSTYWMSPRPEVLLAMTDTDFKRLGLTFKAGVLRFAAEYCLENGCSWGSALPLNIPNSKSELQSIPRIGPWTAGATIADLTNDFTAYPVGDLAVRTWAKTIYPSFEWPTRENEFEDLWRRMAKSRLSEVTMLTLAWGGTHGIDIFRATSGSRR